jgi:SSS family solute:Na+ symporter
MLGMGLWARSRVKTAREFFTAGGAMTWWLPAISHPMTGQYDAVLVHYTSIS